METGNQGRKLAVGAYEFIGTALIMFSSMTVSGYYNIEVSFAMLVLAWNVSGGHFNPVISLGMYIAEKDFKGNLVTLAILVVS